MKSPLDDYRFNAASIQPEETEPFLSPNQYQRLLQNGGNWEQCHFPVAYLYMPQGGVQWLLSAIDPEDPAMAFGLCNLGFGVPELETVSFAEINLIRGELILPIECDNDFKPLTQLMCMPGLPGLPVKLLLTADY